MSVRGLALIIVNSFKGLNNERKGADHDYKGLKNLFENLDFEVKDLKDLKYDDLEKKLGEIKGSPRIANPECFVCVVSSHGSEMQMGSRKIGKEAHSDENSGVWSPVFETSDSLPYSVNKLVERFSDWGAYAGKPKLFFIQACRKKDEPQTEEIPEQQDPSFDRGRPVDLKQDIDSTVSVANKEGDAMDGTKSRDIPDSKASKQAAAGDMIQPTYDTSVIECPEDCLIMFPVAFGRYALRNDEKGSWMLRYMYEREEFKLVDNLIADGRVLPFLTGVADAIASRDFHPYEKSDETTKCAAYITHRLTVDVLFKPMSDASKMAEARKKFRLSA